METKEIIKNDDAYINKFTVFCLTITFLITIGLWILNLLNIFIVEPKIFLMAIICSFIIIVFAQIIPLILGYENTITKYIVLFLSVCLYSSLYATLTYHITLALFFPIIYSIPYKKKSVIWYTYILNIIGMTISIFIGYHIGICDANMVLFTYTTTSSFIETFRNIELVKNPYFQIFLFFCFPKYIILLSIIPIVQKIIYILNDKAMKLIDANNKNIQIQNNLVISLASIIASRDETTGNHVRNSSKYAEFLVQKLRDKNIFKEELTEEYANLVKKAAILHDVGKIKISDTILCKNGKLTDEEYMEIKKHTIYGQEIMKDLIKGIDNSDEYLDIATKMALSHHERYDGKGYPYGLKGDEIPLCARIMAVADVLDALLSKRQYKEKYSFDKTYEILSKEYDKQFDGKILKVLLDNWEEFKKIERD